MTDILAALRAYDFRDTHGHPLEMCAEFQEMVADIARLRAAVLTACEAADKNADTVARLRSELEAARKDAKRYRWLRDRHWVQPEAEFRLNLNDCGDDQERYWRDLDAAIDSEIAKGA